MQAAEPSLHLVAARAARPLGANGNREHWMRARLSHGSDGSLVAVKVLNPETARKPDALRRFLKEARLLAEVQHPNVANLLEGVIVKHA